MYQKSLMKTKLSLDVRRLGKDKFQVTKSDSPENYKVLNELT